MTTEINVLALVKGSERYIFLFDDQNRVETLRQLGRFAANPELSFTWYDAAVMSQKIRETARDPQSETGAQEWLQPRKSRFPRNRFASRFSQGQDRDAA